MRLRQVERASPSRSKAEHWRFVMNKLAYALAVAAGLAAITGQAAAQNAVTQASPGGAADTSATCPSSSDASGGGTVSASGGSVSNVQNVKVFSCNGIRVGTAVSTTTGPNGITLTVAPDANFVNGVTSFQVTAKGATVGEGQVTLAMTDKDVRASLASDASGGSA